MRRRPWRQRGVEFFGVEGFFTSGVGRGSSGCGFLRQWRFLRIVGRAAAAVAEAGDVTRAAVAPARAAEVYGLSVLRNDLQDFSDNRTRFVLLSSPKA